MNVTDVCVLVDRLGPYHHARLRAAGGLLKLTALEVFEKDQTYAWDPVPGSEGFERLSLFKEPSEARSSGHVRERVEKALASRSPRAVAIHGWWERSALAALGWCLRSGTPAILLSESQSGDWTGAVGKRP